ncbi:ATP-binding protein [Burkholderia plantarii]|uniref:ATP-binding protein n=1 Tax=Burkholderia plantarii TaxID=41899 RepID=UPI0008706628|nr:ATP-binding protein [Burkholderia plantarii]
MSPWPRSLLGRNFLLLVALALASQAAVITVFLTFIQKPRIDDAASLVASQIVAMQKLLAALPEHERSRELLGLNGIPQEAVPFERMRGEPPSGYVLHVFFEGLEARLPPDTTIRWEREGERRFWVRLNVGGRYDWVMWHPGSAVAHVLPWGLICLLLTVATVPVLGAYLMHRPVDTALRRLARAAATVERGEWPDAVPVTGPRELATVAEAFNRMVAVLADLEATRTEMLAGISHDIRTPLTKLRLVVAAPDAFEAAQASAERFIQDIDMIVQQFIDFARGWNDEAVVACDLNELISQLAADYTGLGHSFEASLEPLPPIPVRQISLQRLLMNLMQNAVVYGRTGLAVRTRAEPGWAIVCVEDRGPGVPDAMLPLIMQPFRRGTQDSGKGGTGLGLAIVARIASQHGGRLELSANRPHGLIATVRLPLAPPRASGARLRVP